MRGLTPFERAHLLRWAHGEPDFYPARESTTPRLEAMHVAGRVHRITRGDARLWPPTDLGRLALRVCPVAE